jgi:hypothetical protein
MSRDILATSHQGLVVPARSQALSRPLAERMPIVNIEESRTARERRAWVERQERFKDLQEEYERRSAAASSPEEKRQLAQVFSGQRKAHREGDVRLGKRSPGMAVQMHQIMWARWIEVAVEHELEARRAYLDIVAKPESDAILREFRASLVAVTAAAHTVEAVFGDIKYLIPPQPRRSKRHQELRHGFRVAFGVSGATDERLAEELNRLFTLRDSAAHPYTESEPPARHPAGINTGVEHSQFNAITSRRAVDAAMAALELAASPPSPSGRWVERWVSERAPYQVRIQQLRSTEIANPCQLLERDHIQFRSPGGRGG